jgi:hypothetical protein
MNIDDLKDAWNHDEPKGMRLTISAAMLGKTTSAVERVRKNMKSEFIALLVSYIGLMIYIAVMSLYGQAHTYFFFNMISILVFTIMVINAFYYFRFYVFYKSISRYDLNIAESINKITYELELNTEIYKTYNFCVTPLAVLITITLVSGKSAFDYIWRILSSGVFISSGNLLIVFAIILISFIVTYACISYHIRSQYGRYLNELKLIKDDLENGEPV